MNQFTVRNPHEALPIILDAMFKSGVSRDTRNGKVLQLRGPTTICYERPLERVIFWPERDANPYFHLLEAMWLLAGRNDVEFVARYAKRMREFSDDGKTFNGAYGYRWRKHFGYDQLEWIADELQANPNSRRCVLSMWDPGSHEPDGTPFEGTGDLYLGFHGFKDVPCNTHAYFAINDSGFLDMTVCNRSNDLVWGCLGANVVHFSFLLEYMAAKIGVPVGYYYQISNNLHGYLETIEPLRDLAGNCLISPYENGFVKPYPLMTSCNAVDEDIAFHEDLENLDKYNGASAFFRDVVEPVRAAHQAHKAGDSMIALQRCKSILASDWRMACEQWLQRRINKKNRAMNDGVQYE
jgi:thymidylate synthase